MKPLDKSLGIFLVNLASKNGKMNTARLMEIQQVQSREDLEKQTENLNPYFVLFFKPGHDASGCALQRVSEIAENFPLFVVDVSNVRDIHGHFGVNSVPTLIVVENNRVKNTVKGCQSAVFYEKILKGEGSGTKNTSAKTQPRVTVYSTPSCPYCNKLKQYLNKHGIRYTDINVAANPQAAEEMVRKSGQRGVPQTDINGKIIIGFDVPKLSKLLEIPTE